MRFYALHAQFPILYSLGDHQSLEGAQEAHKKHPLVEVTPLITSERDLFNWFRVFDQHSDPDGMFGLCFSDGRMEYLGVYGGHFDPAVYEQKNKVRYAMYFGREVADALIAQLPEYRKAEQPAAPDYSKISPPTWVPLREILPIIESSVKMSSPDAWRWYRNPRCKYIELRVDMRDGRCLIADNYGKSITLAELEKQ